MFSQISVFLLNAILGFFVYLALLRFYMQCFGAPFRNPIGQFVLAFTEWAIRPLRRLIPLSRGLDWVTFGLALAAELVLVFATVALTLPPGPFDLFSTGLLILAVIELLKKALILLIVVVLLDFALSWTNPHTPIAPVPRAITRPLYAICRRFVPAIGGFDLSPLILVLLFQVMLIVLDDLYPRIRHLL
jgi:YggT family protein